MVRQYCDVLGAALGRAGGIGDGHEGQAQALGAAAYGRFVVEVAGHDAAGVGATGRGGGDIRHRHLDFYAQFRVGTTQPGGHFFEQGEHRRSHPTVGDGAGQRQPHRGGFPGVGPELDRPPEVAGGRLEVDVS